MQYIIWYASTVLMSKVKPHAETRSRWLVDAILNFGVFVRAFPTQVLTISSWRSRHKLCGNFDQSIAVPTNMLNGFQSSCDRQHRQQPLLHNSKWLFSRYKCVLRKWKFSKDTRNLFASHVKCEQEFKVYFEFRMTNQRKLQQWQWEARIALWLK